MAGFRVASRRRVRLRAALSGPSKSGKSFKSLLLANTIRDVLRDAKQIQGNGEICVIDSERGRSEMYSDRFPAFTVYELDDYSPTSYVRALKACEEADFSFVIVDQISHEWDGKGGLLQTKDQMVKSSGGKLNDFTAYKYANPLHDEFIDALLSYPGHLIATMRSKIKYEVTQTERGMTPTKIGMEPIQRDSTEYEFDFWGKVNMSHYLEVEARGSLGDILNEKPWSPDDTEEVGRIIGRWLTEGVAIFDPAAPSIAPVEEIRAFLKLAREAGRTDANLLQALKYFGVDSFNQLPAADLKKLLKKAQEKASVSA